MSSGRAVEPTILRRHREAGWIEVICGSMFSGKTEELIRRLRRARFARQRISIFKPAIDVRFSEAEVVSHDENALISQPVATAAQILLLAGDADVVGIDEAQFFDHDLVRVCRLLAAAGHRVIVAGLDQDYRGEPFDPVPHVMAIAEYVTKLHAICVVCGSPANHSQRIVTGRSRVLVGANDAYEPRCRDCFDPTEGDESVGPAVVQEARLEVPGAGDSDGLVTDESEAVDSATENPGPVTGSQPG